MTRHHSLFRRLTAACTMLSLVAGCASTTVIRTEPSDATLYIDGSKTGKTPYSYSDTKITGSTTSIRISKEGYEDFQTVLVRNEQVDAGAIVGGLFFWVPFLWVMGYKPEHTYEMTPLKRDSARRSSTTTQKDPGTI